MSSRRVPYQADSRPASTSWAVILGLFLLLVGGLAAESGLSYYMVRFNPAPMSNQDIKNVADFEKLTNILLPTTKAVLERDGEVAQPIAFGIEMSDRLDFLNPEGRSTLESLALLTRDLKQGAHSGFYRSYAISYDTSRHETDAALYDAIEFRFEHIDGEALRGWFSYQKGADGHYTYSVTHYERMAPEVFSHHNMEWGDGD